jgi:hypothetical protein
MFRKRYTVVIVGEAGSSAAQRSEVSQHRSERDALLAAQYERERLGTMHGDGTGKYRVVVEREGEVISTGPVADLSGLPPEFAHGDPNDELEMRLEESSTDPGRTHRIIRADDLSAPPSGAEPRPEPSDIARSGDDLSAPGESPIPSVAAAPDEDVPEGRVPEDILRRFEEAIAREQERKSARLPRQE